MVWTKLLICLLVVFEVSFAETKLTATAENSCAPWDGPAVLIFEKTLNLQVGLYQQASIDQFDLGSVIKVTKERTNLGNQASIKKKEGQGFEPIAVELMANPKTGEGYILLDGKKHPTMFKRIKVDQPCG